jgi:hypothetical protein
MSDSQSHVCIIEASRPNVLIDSRFQINLNAHVFAVRVPVGYAPGMSMGRASRKPLSRPF